MRSYLLLIALTTAFTTWAQGQFDELINTIVDNNESLKSQYHQNVAQSLDDADANSLADPSVDFARVWGRHGIGNKLQLDVSQSFDWPGLYSARSQAADIGMSAAQAEYISARFQLANQARQLLIELVYVRRQKMVIVDLINNYNALSEAIDKGVRGGELTILDQRKMQIERYEIDNDYCRAISREQQIISEISALSSATLNLDDINAYPIQPVLTRQQYLDQIDSDPDVIAMQLTADHESANAKVASRSRMPSFSVGYQHQAEMGDRFNGFTVGMSLPFFSNRHARRAALDRKDAADLNRNMILTKRKAEVNGTYNDLEIFRDRVEAYNKAFGDNKYLDILLKAYRGGELSVIEYLSELHYYHQTMLAYVESEYNYNLSLSNLNCYTYLNH